MLKLLETKRFKKDLTRMKKRGKLFDRYKVIITCLINEQELPNNFHAHSAPSVQLKIKNVKLKMKLKKLLHKKQRLYL